MILKLFYIFQIGKSQRLLKEREANGNIGHLNDLKKNFENSNLMYLNDSQRGDDSDSDLNGLDEDLDKRSSVQSNEDHLTINSLQAESPNSNMKNVNPNLSQLQLTNQVQSSLMSNLSQTNNSLMNSNNNLAMRLEMNQIANAAVAHALKSFSNNTASSIAASNLKNNLLTNNSINLANTSQLPLQPILSTSTPTISSSVLSTSSTSSSSSSFSSSHQAGSKLSDKNLRNIPSLIDNLNMKNNSNSNGLSAGPNNNSLLNPFISSSFMPKFNHHSFDAFWKQQSNQNLLSLRYPLINSINNDR